MRCQPVNVIKLFKHHSRPFPTNNGLLFNVQQILRARRKEKQTVVPYYLGNAADKKYNRYALESYMDLPIGDANAGYAGSLLTCSPLVILAYSCQLSKQLGPKVLRTELTLCRKSSRTCLASSTRQAVKYLYRTQRWLRNTRHQFRLPMAFPTPISGCVMGGPPGPLACGKISGKLGIEV